MVGCFCDTVLEINDASELDFDETRNQFFKKYGPFLKEKTLKADLKIYQEILHNYLTECCLKYIQVHLTKSGTNFPFYYYEKEKMDAYKKAFLLHLQSYTASKSIENFFDLLFDWIDNIQKEHMADAIHIAKKIDEKNNFNADAFNNRLESQKTELECQKKKLEEQIAEYEKLKQQIDNSTDALEKLQKEATSIDDKILKAENAQKERLHSTEKNMIQTSISILGVFSAVVLTFNMGISFAADVLQTFMQSSIYHSVLVILLFGFIIGNVVFALFAFLRHIHKDITKESFKETLLGKIIKYFNIVLAALLVINIACWLFGASEYRDKWVDKRVQECFSEIDTTNMHNV